VINHTDSRTLLQFTNGAYPDMIRFRPIVRRDAALGDRGMAEAPKKILCIDDDRELARLIANELSERGFDVEARDGTAAGAG
jgi:PleD family two-component response regulator